MKILKKWDPFYPSVSEVYHVSCQLVFLILPTQYLLLICLLLQEHGLSAKSMMHYTTYNWKKNLMLSWQLKGKVWKQWNAVTTLWLFILKYNCKCRGGGIQETLFQFPMEGKMCSIMPSENSLELQSEKEQETEIDSGNCWLEKKSVCF